MANYLYNSIELPQLPEWDKSTYPCAQIHYSNSNKVTQLTLTKTPCSYFGSAGKYIKSPTPLMYCTLTEDGTWGEFAERGSSKVHLEQGIKDWAGNNAGTLIWANHDVISEIDGSIYLAASAPVPTKYLYNDIELSALPEWDKTAYPYAAIINDGGSKYPKYATTLVVSDKPLIMGVKIWDGSLYWCSETPIRGMRFTHWMVDDWEFEREFEITEKSTIEEITDYYLVASSDYALWSNYDILNADGSLHLAASYPTDSKTGEEIHDYEIGGNPTLTARDLYRKINGNLVKHDLYRVVDGKLIPLDEYTKAVKTNS